MYMNIPSNLNKGDALVVSIGICPLKLGKFTTGPPTTSGAVVFSMAWYGAFLFKHYTHESWESC